MAMLISVQVGQPQTLADETPSSREKIWNSSIFKSRVDHPIWLRGTNLDGDRQTDLENHGGVDKTVCVYPIEHYSYWRQIFGLTDMPDGAFGENFTTRGLLESDVCIGDQFEVGQAVVQISQPRQPCWKLAQRWHIKDLALQVQQTGYTGWYFRVIQEGLVEADHSLRLLDRPYPQWTIAEANHIMHERKTDYDAARQLAQCELLSASWKKTLSQRAENHHAADSSKRLHGG